MNNKPKQMDSFEYAMYIVSTLENQIPHATEANDTRWLSSIARAAAYQLKFAQSNFTERYHAYLKTNPFSGNLVHVVLNYYK